MTQAQKVWNYMCNHPEGITPLEALDHFGIMRLAARINDLIRDGHSIKKTMVCRKTEAGATVHFMRYSKGE